MTRFDLERPGIRNRIIGLVLDGKSDREIAASLTTAKRSVSFQAISKFRHRHADVLKPAIAEAERQATDYAIANKVNRIATDDMLVGLLEQVRRARAEGGTGIETGLVVRQYKALGSGLGMRVVEEYKIDPALVELIDRLHNSVSDELGQKPKPDVHNTVNVGIVVRQVEGYTGLIG